ncbi:MAG: response regulator [Bacteroidetes bacterium]|nr:MAG: response regulator [Bacteroidota bacterium]
MDQTAVLIVEDSPGFAELLKYVAEDEGYKPVIFPLEEQLLDWVEKTQPSVICMDIALNRLNGFDFIHELKKHAKFKRIPIIVITGRDLSVKEITDLKVNEVNYLRKGRVDMHEIHLALKEAVQKNPPAKQEKLRP